MTKASDILFQAADIYEAQGTCRRTLYDSNEGKSCSLGVIAEVATGSPLNGYAVKNGEKGAAGRLAVVEFEKAINESTYYTRFGNHYNSNGHPIDVVSFNDAARTSDGRLLNARTIAGKMRKAARRLAKRGK